MSGSKVNIQKMRCLHTMAQVTKLFVDTRNTKRQLVRENVL